MEYIVKALILYIFILILFRASGKRSLSQITTFDFVLLLIVGETVQQGLLGSDYSLINAILLITTLVGFEVLISFFSKKWNLFDHLTNGVPVIILKNGEPLWDRMEHERIGIEDILESARQSQGLKSLEQIEYAVLEKDGRISVIPK